LDKSYLLVDNQKMELTPARTRLSLLIARHETNMADLSDRVLGKNVSYIQQYLTKGSPKKLDEEIRQKLGEHFSVDPDVFKEDYVEKSGILPGNAITTITVDELDVQASAGNGATVESNPVVARWTLSRASLRSIGTAPASNLKIIQVIGDSMAPTFFSGQKVLVDTSNRVPTHPGIYVVWDGLGLLVKRVEHIAHSTPPRVRIYSDNPAYSARETELEEANIQGRVVGAWSEY
jgi:phage repressor protein C with HTH and peptisase S24 domain